MKTTRVFWLLLFALFFVAESASAQGLSLGERFRISPIENGIRARPGPVSCNSFDLCVVTWNQTFTPPGAVEPEIWEGFAQLYGAPGEPVGDPIRLHPPGSSRLLHGVLIDEEGGFAALTRTITSGRIDQFGDVHVTNSILLHRYNADGTPRGNEVLVFQRNNFTPIGMELAQDGAGNLLIAYQVGHYGTADFRSEFQRFDVQGNPIGSPVTVVQGTDVLRPSGVPVASFDSQGGFILLWDELLYADVDQVTEEATSTLYMRLYDSNANALGQKTPVESHSGSTDWAGLTVTRQQNDDFLLSWTETQSLPSEPPPPGVFGEDYNYSSQPYFQWFDSGGTPLGAKIAFAPYGEYKTGLISGWLVQHNENTLIAVWNFSLNELVAGELATTSEIYAQALDLAGNPLSTEILVASNLDMEPVVVAGREWKPGISVGSVALQSPGSVLVSMSEGTGVLTGEDGLRAVAQEVLFSGTTSAASASSGGCGTIGPVPPDPGSMLGFLLLTLSVILTSNGLIRRIERFVPAVPAGG